ncbi:unnamed protein product [Paramecium pentaurelia]|uniref:Uncharacterized protein n=1 Tax=Paramecium pentaurelia TaxID=43138 RepID=A0A8S1Y496_9CILI|nr:unnamed protein product [Paramecium pentaurelia]
MMNLQKYQIKHLPLIHNIAFLFNLKVYVQKSNKIIKKLQFITRNHQRQIQMINGQQTKRKFARIN